MRCTDFEKYILLADSGEIPAKRRAPLATHLAQCPHCRAFQSDVLALRTLDGQARTDSSPSAKVMDRILAAAESRRPGRDVPTPYFGRRMLAMAAGLSLILGTWYVATRTPNASPAADLSEARIAACSSLLAAMMETDSLACEMEDVTQTHADLPSLARQLLILQDMSVDPPEDLTDSATPNEAIRPTTLQWRSTHATTAQTCG